MTQPKNGRRPLIVGRPALIMVDFQRVGPFSVSLRKVNFKRKSYDLAMIVDDNQLQKKSVNLYEPVWIRVGDHPQPAELVVWDLA